MGELERKGRREPEIREFFEGMEDYMQKHHPVKVPGPRRARPAARRKARAKFPRVRVSNRTITRLRSERTKPRRLCK